MSKHDEGFTRYSCVLLWESLFAYENTVNSGFIPEEVREKITELQELLLNYVGSGYTVKYSKDIGFDYMPLG